MMAHVLNPAHPSDIAFNSTCHPSLTRDLISLLPPVSDSRTNSAAPERSTCAITHEQVTMIQGEKAQGHTMRIYVRF